MSLLAPNFILQQSIFFTKELEFLSKFDLISFKLVNLLQIIMNHLESKIKFWKQCQAPQNAE